MSAVDWIMFWLVSFLSVQKSKLFFVKKLKKIIENSALMPQKSEFNYFYSLFPQWIGLMGTPHDPDVWNVFSVGDDLARKIGLGLRAVVGDIWVIMLIRKIKNNTLGIWNYKGKIAGRKSENSNVFHKNQNVFHKKKVTPLQEFMGVFSFFKIRGFSEIIRIILKLPDPISWLLLPRSSQGQPHPNYLSLTWNHILVVLQYSQKGKVVYVNPHWILIFGFCVVNFWEIQSQF